MSLNFSESSDEDFERSLLMVKKFGLSLSDVSEKFRDNKKIVRAAVKNDSSEFRYASPRLRDDKLFMKSMLGKFCCNLEFFSPRLQDDSGIVLEAIRHNGLFFEYASERLKDDRDFVIKAMACVSFCNPFQFASARLRDDYKLARLAVRMDAGLICCVSERLKIDKRIVLVAVRNSPNAFRYINDKFRDDLEVMLEMVKHDDAFRGRASDRLQQDVTVLYVAKFRTEIAQDDWPEIKAYLISNQEKLNAFGVDAIPGHIFNLFNRTAVKSVELPNNLGFPDL